MKKLWVVILIILIGAFAIWWYFNPQNIRKAILNQLEEKLEFCEIVKDDINILTKSGNFWMICNGRPFYAEYNDGKLRYEMNGWGWIKNTDFWSEYEEMKGICEVYHPEDGNLRFFCYKDGVPKLLSYSFDRENFTLNKIKEENLIDVLADELKSKYTFLSACTLENYTASGTLSPTCQLYFSCGNQNYVIKTDLNFVIIAPSVLNQNSILTTFRNVFNIEPEITNSKANAQLEFSNLTIDYSTEMTFILPLGDLSNVINEMGDKFLLNFEKTNPENIQFVKEEAVKNFGTIKSYKMNNKIIRLYIDQNGAIEYAHQNMEGFSSYE